MARNFIILFFITFLSSCISVEFTQPQPYWCANLTLFPNEMQGHFYSNENDTVEIGSNYYKLISKDSNSILDTDTKNTEQLSDSLLFKPYKKIYFLNSKTNGNWQVSMVKINKNHSITVYNAISSEEKLIKKLKNIKDKTILKDETGKIKRVILNPSEKEFKKLFRSKLFVEYMVLKKVN